MKERKPPMQRAPLLMMPLLVMALSASLAKLAWMVVSPVQDVSAAPITAVAQPIQNRQTINLGRVIADNHLFGEVPKRAPVRNIPTPRRTVPTTPAIPTKPPIKLSLHGLWAKKHSGGRTENSFKSIPIDGLSGTGDIISQIAADLDSLFVLNVLKSAKNVPPEKARRSAFAIISLAGSEQKMYTEGESIADGVKVLEIFADKIIVKNQGVKQEIFLTDGDNTNTTRKPTTQQAPRSATAGQNRLTPNAPKRRNANLGQQDLRQLRTDIMNDVSILAQYAAPEPLLLDGEVKGFRLHLSNRLRLLYQIGFRPGDVITELNGVRLNDPDTVQQTLYNFISANQLAVSVMRGQEEETFRYSFDG